MKQLFGTDGVRGTANIYPMTSETAMAIGRAIAYLYKGQKGRHRIVVGKDTRLSGYMLENALTAGICSMGSDALLTGPLPTPAISFVTQSMRADAGVVISASHNPFQDNGIKIFDSHGYKLEDSVEEKIEQLVLKNGIDDFRPTAEAVGKAYRIDDAKGRYIEFIKHTFPNHLTLDGLKIVLDCSNGAAYSIAPIVMEELGADVIPINVSPNGTNINEKSGCLDPNLLANLVTANRADVGIALDGDADRAVFADDKGQVVSGDTTIAICALKLLREGKLRRNKVVVTEMSNVALGAALAEFKIEVERCDVGDRNVVEALRRNGTNFGGESSGHLVFFDELNTGDGMIAALQVLAEIVGSGRTLSELASVYHPYPQVLKNVKVKEKRDLADFKEVSDMMAHVKSELGTEGRLLVRFSGTEPLARILVEGKDSKIIEGYAGDIADVIQRAIGY